MYYEKNGFKIYYEKIGANSNKQILILPGWGNNRKTFNNLINKLKDKSQIFIIDYPGFGNSPFPNKNLTIYDYSNIIKDFITDLNIHNPSIIAHSFGGRISTLLSGLYNIKISKLVLIDIAGIRRKSIKRFIKTIIYKLKKKLSIFLPKTKRIKYILYLRKKSSSNDYYNLNKNMYITFKNIIHEDLRKYVKNIKTQTLIIWGKKDIDTPIKDAYYYKKRITNSKLIIYNNSSHFVYIEEKDVLKQIVYFLD